MLKNNLKGLDNVVEYNTFNKFIKQWYFNGKGFTALEKSIVDKMAGGKSLVVYTILKIKWSIKFSVELEKIRNYAEDKILLTVANKNRFYINSTEHWSDVPPKKQYYFENGKFKMT